MRDCWNNSQLTPYFLFHFERSRKNQETITWGPNISLKIDCRLKGKRYVSTTAWSINETCIYYNLSPLLNFRGFYKFKFYSQCHKWLKFSWLCPQIELSKLQVVIDTSEAGIQNGCSEVWRGQISLFRIRSQEES